jgi:hypothetical protein
VSADAWRFQARHWLLVVVATAAAAVVGTPSAPAVAVGGATIGAFTLAYATIFVAVLRRGRLGLALLVLFVKVTALVTLGWVVLSYPSWRPDPLGFTIGVSCLPVAAAWEAVRAGKH